MIGHLLFNILLKSTSCNLDARAVISVESPHATTAGAASSNSWGLRRAWQVSLREYCYVIPSGTPWLNVKIAWTWKLTSWGSFPLPHSPPTTTRARTRAGFGFHILGMKDVFLLSYLLGLPAPTLVALAAGPGMSEMSDNWKSVQTTISQHL